ncbi:MAG: formate--phosphoribosylaminoimidazolecarboxamide ligase family protein [Candidatus Micrarchaeia archaeon]
MISGKEIQEVIRRHRYSRPCIATLGSHSALDICLGAKKEGLKTIVVCQKGREETYARFYKSDGKAGVVDEVIVLDRFADVVKDEVQEKLRRAQAVFVPHRSFEVYVGFDRIENDFLVPLFGNRALLRAEERDAPRNQYFLLEKAGIRTPKRFASPKDIDRTVIVKVAEAKRTYERAFFFAHDLEDYTRESTQLIAKGVITKEGLEKAVIEEVVCGAQCNFNFFHSPLTGRLELLGTDVRRQTNLDGVLRLPADEQLELLKRIRLTTIEAGHVAVTLRESLLESVLKMGEAFAKASKEEYPPGVIGPFALQGALVPEEGREEPVVFDVSLRMPGSPGTRFTPYSEYLHGESMSVGQRVAREIKQAARQGRIEKVVT